MAVLHVSTAGSNGGNGSIGDPLRTLAFAWSVVGPGDTILARRGDSFNEQLAPGVSGNSGANIEMGAYGSGARPRLLSSSGRPLTLTGRTFIRIRDFDFAGSGGGHPCVLLNGACRDLHFLDCDAFNASRRGWSIQGTVGDCLFERIVGRDNGDSDTQQNKHGLKIDISGGPGNLQFKACRFHNNREDGVQFQCSVSSSLVFAEFDADCEFGPGNFEGPVDLKGTGTFILRGLIDARGGSNQSVAIADHNTNGNLHGIFEDLIVIPQNSPSQKGCVDSEGTRLTFRRVAFMGDGNTRYVIRSIGTAGPVEFENCLLFRNAGGDALVEILNGAAAHTFRGNTMIAQGAFDCVSSTGGTHQFDQNLFYSTQNRLLNRTGGSFNFQARGNGYERANSDSGWYNSAGTSLGRSAVGTAAFDANGMAPGNPQFETIEPRPWRLRIDSPFAHVVSATLLATDADGMPRGATSSYGYLEPISDGTGGGDPGGGGGGPLATGPFIFPRITPMTAERVFRRHHQAAGGWTVPGLGVQASLGGDGVFHMEQDLPNSLPAGIPNLRLRARANATTGAARIRPKWISIPSGGSIDILEGALNDEGTQTLTWGAGDNDKLKQIMVPLDAGAIAGGEVLAVMLIFETAGWTLAATSWWSADVIFV